MNYVCPDQHPEPLETDEQEDDDDMNDETAPFDVNNPPFHNTPTLHPKRCETCCKFASPDCPHENKEIAHDYGDDRFIGYSIQRERTSEITDVIGCASHSSTTDADARQRIEDAFEEHVRKISSASVDRELILHEQIKQERKKIADAVKELEKDIKKSENSYEGTKYTEVTYRSGLKKAIAILKNGVGRK